MARNVTALVMGGSKKVLDGVNTVAEVAARLNAGAHTATVNGDPATASQTLNDNDFVSFAQAVKGA